MPGPEVFNDYMPPTYIPWPTTHTWLPEEGDVNLQREWEKRQELRKKAARGEYVPEFAKESYIDKLAAGEKNWWDVLSSPESQAGREALGLAFQRHASPEVEGRPSLGGLFRDESEAMMYFADQGFTPLSWRNENTQTGEKIAVLTLGRRDYATGEWGDFYDVKFAATPVSWEAAYNAEQGGQIWAPSKYAFYAFNAMPTRYGFESAGGRYGDVWGVDPEKSARSTERLYPFGPGWKEGLSKGFFTLSGNVSEDAGNYVDKERKEIVITPPFSLPYDYRRRPTAFWQTPRIK